MANQDIKTLLTSLSAMGFSIMLSVHPKQNDPKDSNNQGRTFVDIYSPFSNKYINKQVYGSVDIEELFNEVAVDAMKSMIK